MPLQPLLMLDVLQTSSPPVTSLVAVGTEVTPRPPHRSVRAELPHTAPTSGVTHKSAPLDMSAYFGVVEQTAQQSD